MRLKEGLRLRELGGKRIIVDSDGERADLTYVYTLNEAAALLWKKCDGCDFTEDELADALVGQYGIEREQALKDVRRQLAEWGDFGLIQKD